MSARRMMIYREERHARRVIEQLAELRTASLDGMLIATPAEFQRVTDLAGELAEAHHYGVNVPVLDYLFGDGKGFIRLIPTEAVRPTSVGI